MKFHVLAILVSVVLLGGFVLPATISAAPSDNSDAAKIPSPLTKTQEEAFTNMALSDKSVRDSIGGKDFEGVGVGFFTENIDVENPIWQPVVHLNVKDTGSVAAFLDPSGQEVTRIEEQPLVKAAINAAFASNYYTGASTVNGLRMTTTAPTYAVDATTNMATLFLLNAVENNADVGKLCNPAFYATSYWAQVGLVWTTNARSVMWADNATQCITQSTGINYVAGHVYENKIYTSGGTWYIVAKDTNTGSTFTKTRTGITYVVFENSEFNNGIFFENHNTGTSWYTKYASPHEVSATAKYSSNNGSTWSNWQSGGKQDSDCGGPRVPSTIISGNVAGGGTATWDLQDMSALDC
ncbi:hypothetical protein [Candidatus Nitrososphaera sp. FF02]|uniref:hypothetical protein n=1 Tax=Candidatus Nitrososphaera sp. FF02 TaxID=3398226 RepID=UPI0039E83DB2